jgi:hypothetical protein
MRSIAREAIRFCTLCRGKKKFVTEKVQIEVDRFSGGVTGKVSGNYIQTCYCMWHRGAFQSLIGMTFRSIRSSYERIGRLVNFTDAEVS